ncbi:DNA primase small subunit-like isoform X1 [Papaver somniferum]|uniref:DNA primase small subunit-like isoform X1 n=1 Tax=Papaver somniferum TaxID=3469 RepID=UPI000E6FD731|nr:DNA primase small subunit-like isoform X1 [Papaver somniferum]
MTKEEIDNDRDDMMIDEREQQGFPLMQCVQEEFDPEQLKFYYGRLFPYADIYKWMSYGNDRKHPACDLSYFGRREFSFILGNDVYLRYQSFNSAAQMENSIKSKCPFKIDIGAVYSVDPAKRNAYAGENAFTPVEKELVFDIDMSDYDDVRYCCSGANICQKCWPLMTIAIKVIDSALREDFGFTHILWVYSGRRGVHCWVCDARARRLNNAQRAAIADYFHVYKGNENSRKKVFLGGPALHPSLVRSYQQVLRPFFEEDLLCGQSLLETEEKFEKILEMIPDESITAKLRGEWLGNHHRSSNSKEDINRVRWEKLKSHLQSGKQKWLRRCIEEIIFSYTYPRLDMGVTKLTNHLLKAPFCVHPKTGRVCVPIDPKHCEEFDPMAVPTLSSLKKELDTPDLENGEGKKFESGRTSLDKSLTVFRLFLDPLLKSCKEEMEISYNAKLQQSKSSLTW